MKEGKEEGKGANAGSKDFCSRVQQWPMFVVRMTAAMQENILKTSGECLAMLP